MYKRQVKIIINQIIKSLAISLMIISVCISCSRNDGSWDDIIELSQSEVLFTSDADSIIVTTNGEGWWISNISFNEEELDLSSLDTTKDQFDIIETEFIVSRNSKKEMQIKITENDSLQERKLIIGLQAGNYFDHLRIIQEGR